jgi:hypothetical protein
VAAASVCVRSAAPGEASDGPTEEVTSCRRTPSLRHLPSATGVSVADPYLERPRSQRILSCQAARRHKIVKMLTRSFTAGRMAAPEHLSQKGPCELFRRSPGCDDDGRPRTSGSPPGEALVRAQGQVAVTPERDLAVLDSRHAPTRLVRGWRPLAALVPSTRSSRRFGAEDLTICASQTGQAACVAGRDERIEERRDQ